MWSNQNELANMSVNAALHKMDEINKSSMTSDNKVAHNQLLLISLSTIVMLAKRKPLSQEYYEKTRTYLQSIRNSQGQRPKNIVGLLKEMKSFRQQQNIPDNLEGTIFDRDLTTIVINEPSECQLASISESGMHPKITSTPRKGGINNQPEASSLNANSSEMPAITVQQSLEPDAPQQSDPDAPSQQDLEALDQLPENYTIP